MFLNLKTEFFLNFSLNAAQPCLTLIPSDLSYAYCHELQDMVCRWNNEISPGYMQYK